MKNIILKQTSLITETLLSLYAKIVEMNIKVNRLKEVVQSLSRQLQTIQAQRECSHQKLIESTPATSSQATDFKEADAFQPRSLQCKSSCMLQNNQLSCLTGQFKTNYGRWGNKKAIEN